MDENTRKNAEHSIDMDAYSFVKLKLLIGPPLVAASTALVVEELPNEDFQRVSRAFLHDKRKEFDEILMTALRSMVQLTKEITAELGIETADSLSQPTADSSL